MLWLEDNSVKFFSFIGKEFSMIYKKYIQKAHCIRGVDCALHLDIFYVPTATESTLKITVLDNIFFLTNVSHNTKVISYFFL